MKHDTDDSPMTTMAIVQARMGSTRLPGKVLADIAGKPMLARVMERLGRAASIREIRVATTSDREDDQIAVLCKEEGWPCYRGAEHDLLDRYFQASLAGRADCIVRVTSDCPLIDPKIVDLVVQKFAAALPPVDYASNTLPPRTYPRGLDVEVFSRDALRKAWQEDTNPSWREHATPFLYRSGQFDTLAISNESDLSHLRWTVDTPEDLEFVRRVYEALGSGNFSWLDVLDLIREQPSLGEINAAVRQKEH